MLILNLFDLYVCRNHPPDMLSSEVVLGQNDNEKRVIRFEWDSGKVKDFGYTHKTYTAIWEKFHTFYNHDPKLWKGR